MKRNRGPEAGIYVIEITGCDKFYIGSTLDLKRRKRDHELLLMKNSHKNLHLRPDDIVKMFELLDAGARVLDVSKIIGCNAKTVYRKIASRRLLEYSNGQT